MAQNELWDKQQKIQIQIIEINTAVFFITKICNPQSELQRHVRWFYVLRLMNILKQTIQMKPLQQ